MTHPSLPLFPLHTVLFPGGLLGLKVFEARYLDMVGHCLRHPGSSFAVATLRQGEEVQAPSTRATDIERVATLVRLDAVDAEQAGILHIRCVGTQRVRLSEPWQQPNGLWRAHGVALPDDAEVPVALEHQACALALQKALATLEADGLEPALAPHRLDDSGWVANRWCELLPISLSAKHQLMALEDPRLRLNIVRDVLNTKGWLGSGSGPGPGPGSNPH